MNDCIKKCLSNYSFIECISSTVKKIIYIIEKDNQKFVCKIRQYKDDCQNEINVYYILKNIKNEYVSNYIEYNIIDKYIYFITEYIDGITLYNHIKNNNLNNNEIVLLFIDILKCLIFIHEKNILHCDIKPNNIIVKNDKPVIIDFDLAKIPDNEEGYLSNNLFGTINYLSPESYDLRIYTKYSDIWSLGMMFYILITNEYPFDSKLSNMNSHSNLYRYNEFKHPNLKLLKKNIDKKEYNNSLYLVIEQMLEFKDYNRCSLSDAIQLLEN